MCSQEGLRRKDSSFLDNPDRAEIAAMQNAYENSDREQVIWREEDEARDQESDQQEIQEPQLYEHDGAPVNRKRHKNNEASKKLDAVNWANDKSIKSAAKRFSVTRSRIKDWMKHEAELKQQINTPSGSKRNILERAGRPVLKLDLDIEVAEWVREMRENKLPVSRRIICEKAIRVFQGTEIKVSIGWCSSFLKRHNFVLRRRTTTAQKAPWKYAEVVAKFIVHVEQRRMSIKFSSILAMDETAVWFDCPDNKCIDTKGTKDVTVVTTGHEKMRITVCLTARSDGKKLMPYVLRKLIINWAGSTWMNDSSTEDYLRQVIGGGLFSGKRLLVWDIFASHRSDSTKAVLKESKVEAAYIPGGCTKFIQAPDVYWNKPFKELRYVDEQWRPT